MEKSAIEEKVSRTIRIAGLLVLAGVFLGATLGVYALLNPWLFSVFIDISQYEATPFFLGFYLPSFVTIVALGYIFATTHRLERTDLWHVAPFSVLCLLCVVLSALSPFNILAFMGGFLALIAVVFSHTKPAFRTLWKREACFLVEAGSLLVASSSSLFLLMLLISQFVPTYSVGLAGAETYYLSALLIMEALSFLTFFVVSNFCSRSVNTGLCGILGLVSSVAFSVIAIQNQYFYINVSAYMGVFLVGAGIAFILFGALIYVKLFLSQVVSPTVLTPSFVFRGKYCPYCGEPWTDLARTFCSSCGRSLNWRPEVPFCPYCGRLVSKGVQTCPHCKEDVGSRPVSYSLKRLEKKEPVSYFLKKLEKEEMWSVERESKIQRVLRIVSEYVPLSLKEYVYVVILTFAFAFLSFIGYIGIEPHPTLSRYFLVHYGFPLEWLVILTTGVATVDITISLVGLVLDLIFYSVLALVVVFGVMKFFEYMHR